MALHHVTLVCTLVLLWIIFATVYADSSDSSRLYPARSTREREFREMRLKTSRMYGKRAALMERVAKAPSVLLTSRLYGKRDATSDLVKKARAELLTARGYGKRAANMDRVNNFLVEWLTLDSRLRDMGYTRNLKRTNEFTQEIPE